jgi:hypothetical protein
MYRVSFVAKQKAHSRSGEWALTASLNYCLMESLARYAEARRTDNMRCSYTSASGEELS